MIPELLFLIIYINMKKKNLVKSVVNLPHLHDGVDQLNIRNILSLLGLSHEVLAGTALTMISLNSIPIQASSDDLRFLELRKSQNANALDRLMRFRLPDRHEANGHLYVKIMPDFLEEVNPVIFLVLVIYRPVILELLVCLWIGHVEIQVVSDPMGLRTAETAILEGKRSSSEEYWSVLHEKIMLSDVGKSELSLLVSDLMLRSLEIGLGQIGDLEIVFLLEFSVSPV